MAETQNESNLKFGLRYEVQIKLRISNYQLLKADRR